MVGPLRKTKPVGAHLERMGPEPDKKQMACMAGVYGDALRKNISCLESNRDRMNYNEYLAAGVPIGTGFIAGACRHIITDRMEKTVMRWKEKGAESMLKPTCIDASQLWEITIDNNDI